MKTYFTIMLSVDYARHQKQWFVEEFPIKDPLYGVQLALGLAFATFQECEDAIFERIKRIGGIYLDHIPQLGVKKAYRKRINQHHKAIESVGQAIIAGGQHGV